MSGDASSRYSSSVDQQRDLMTTAVVPRVETINLAREPLQQGLQDIIGRVVETGRLPGAPKIHQKLADYVEYAQAIVNSTTSVSEAVTAQDLMYFAWGLPLFGGEQPRSSDLDAKDIHNLNTLNECMPSIDIDVAQYHVSATYHTGKLLLIAALNPRAIEWIFLAAVMVQRGLSQRITELLLDRKDRFLEVAHQDVASRSDDRGINSFIITFSATLTRMIVNVVTSLKSLNLGELGGQLSLDGPMPGLLDFDHYVTGDPVVWSVVTEARAAGCQFHEEVLLIEAASAECDKAAKRPRMDRSALAKASTTDRWQRIEILRTTPGRSRFTTVNAGPTGRVPHGKLVSGLLHLLLSRVLPPGQREKLLVSLRQACAVRFTLEVDLATGIGDILIDDPTPKGNLELPPWLIEHDLPEPATIVKVEDLLSISPVKNIEFLNFSEVATSNTTNWNQIVLTYLVLKGWWWAKHLILDFPERLFVPNHNSYFQAMASIGATMLHLEQNSGCSITTNDLFDKIRLLTNLGGPHEPMTSEAIVCAAQGPGGTVVHDVLGRSNTGIQWSQNPYLRYRWLQGKFLGVPEVAMFAQGVEWRKEMSSAHLHTGPRTEMKSIETSVTIFADSTDGHTLSCAIVNEDRKIRVLPFSRVLCGCMLAYIGYETDCNHSREDGQTFVEGGGIQSLPWSVISSQYFGHAEVVEEDSVLVTGIEGSTLCQVIALAVTKATTAIDVKGCLVCAFTRSSHVIQTPWTAEYPLYPSSLSEAD